MTRWLRRSRVPIPILPRKLPPLTQLHLSCATFDSMSEGESNQGPIDRNLTPEEANRIIHSHRKVRYGERAHRVLLSVKVHVLNSSIGTACWPCRQRKVKCDNKQPCENCIKRDHANLCSYNPKNAKASAAQVAGIKRPPSPGAGCDNSLKKDEGRWPRTTGSQFLKLPVPVKKLPEHPRKSETNQVSP